MCNILTYSFTCHHSLRRLRSRCSGTKHKPATSSTPAKAACTAFSYLCICLRMDCGACQHQAWEDAWKLKLARARCFLAKTQQKDMPGTEEIAKLVNDLEEVYTTESWKAGNTFANVPKPRIPRVQHTRYQKKSSNLRQEVAPDDVVEKTADKDWSELNAEDYDGDYVASTDPLHPVNTTYDTLWGQGYPGRCDDDQAAESEGYDGGTWNENDSGWDWGDESSEQKNTHEEWHTEDATPDTNLDNPIPRTTHKPHTPPHLPAHRTETEQSTSSTTLQPHNASPSQDQPPHAQRILQTIHTFWSVVNAHPTPPAPLHQPTPTPTTS
ncbi:hypothetical protein BDU57DRAFT_536966 [Ampelomyces quisqualis]|uniref:Uncharacterized protein n=1 Tax=Ampelomyces quisqualis TaxID=50730 RepID=A0A6A5QR13_AMPQU|nr:hypothetical protein BDU57DRAFT_536966 [Ampelomyces quisqualis]